MTEQLETGEFPNLQRSVGADVRAALLRARYETADDERFERGLQRVLDGLELWVRDRRPQ